MDEIFLLSFLCLAMLVGSFLSGLIPLTVRLSDNKSKLLALLGSGILVGTALAIIIPEGIESIYKDSHSQTIAQVATDAPKNDNSNLEDHVYHKANHNEQSSKTCVVGLSLVVGFVLMLLIDQIALYQAQSPGICVPEQTYSSSPNNYKLARQDDEIDITSEEVDGASYEAETGGDKRITNSDTVVLRLAERVETTSANSHLKYYDHSRATHSPKDRNNKVTPTLGLLIHASADGIALGAAATTSHRDIEMIIFLAIMLHKAPAAFSLVVLLIHMGLKHSTIRRHLLAFSLCAPLTALLTYFCLSKSGKEALRRNNATGIAMLFSAGTFLYVATVHVLPEVVNDRLLSRKELTFLIVGAFLPLLLARSI